MSASTNKMSRTQTAGSSGFTLIELMVTIVVLGVTASIAAPSIATQLANQRVKSTTMTLVSVLREARAESSIRRIPVRVSYTTDSQPHNNINVEIPYSGPSIALSLHRPKDWTSFFFKSAVAGGSIPKDNPDNNSGGGNTGGGNTGGGNTGGGNTGGGNTGGGNTGGGNTGGGSTDGGSTDGGSTDGGSTDGGSTGGGSTGGGSTGGGSTGGGSTGGGSTGGGSTGGGSTGGNQNVTFVSIETYKYDQNSIIKSAPATVTFKPQKHVDSTIVYTICDKNTSAAPRQITINKFGSISSKTGGSCS